MDPDTHFDLVARYAHDDTPWDRAWHLRAAGIQLVENGCIAWDPVGANLYTYLEVIKPGWGRYLNVT